MFFGKTYVSQYLMIVTKIFKNVSKHIFGIHVNANLYMGKHVFDNLEIIP